MLMAARAAGRLAVLRPIYLGAAALIGVLLLAQHAHFSIDVLAAPLAAYVAARLQLRLTSPIDDPA